jgi:hypothetical protein
MKKIIIVSSVFIVLTLLMGCSRDSIEETIQKGDRILSEQLEEEKQKDKLNPGDEGYDALVDDPFIYEPPPLENIETEQGEILTRKIKNPTIALVAMDGTDLNSIADGDVFGCNDKIVEYPLEGLFTPKEIVQELITMKEFEPDVGYYSSFVYSENLKVESLQINEKNEVVINLSGQLVTSGTCDGPRPLAQMAETIKLIGLPIENYQVYINGVDFFEVLSNMGDERG